MEGGHVPPGPLPPLIRPWYHVHDYMHTQQLTVTLSYFSPTIYSSFLPKLLPYQSLHYYFCSSLMNVLLTIPCMEHCFMFIHSMAEDVINTAIFRRRQPIVHQPNNVVCVSQQLDYRSCLDCENDHVI